MACIVNLVRGVLASIKRGDVEKLGVKGKGKGGTSRKGRGHS